MSCFQTTLAVEAATRKADWTAYDILATVAKVTIFQLRSGAGASMPTRNISLSAEQNAFIDEVLDAGEYRNASEAMRDAIRALQQRRAAESLKLEKLRLSVKAGVAALERGDYTEVEDEDLDFYLDELATPSLR